MTRLSRVRNTPPIHNQEGVCYIMVMCAIVLMGITMSIVGQQWSMVVKRDREAELAFRGNRIKNAIEAYAADYQIQKAIRQHPYPVRLEQLTQPPKRYLPVIYKDPITGREFDLIKIGDQIRGVKSRSAEAPLNQVQFKGAKRYSDILFQAQDFGAGQLVCEPSSNSINPLLPTACSPVNKSSNLAPAH